MHLTWIRRLVGSSAVAAAIAVSAGADDAASAKLMLPEGTAAKAIEADTAHLAKLFELTKTKKKLEGRVKSTALLIAGYAQSELGGKDGAKMAGVRDQAVKIAEAIAKKDMAGAEAATKGLATAKGSAGGKELDLSKQAKLELAELMDLFGGSGAGGMNLEKDIRAGRKEISAKDAELIGARVMVLAEYTAKLPPEFDAAKKKTPDAWERWSSQMKKTAGDIATEAAKGAKADAARLKKLMSGLDGTCTNCHNVFRE